MINAIKLTLKILFAVIICSVAIVILSNIFSGDIINYLAKKRKLSESIFFNFDGRPYGKLCDAEHCKYALVDTGANISLINIDNFDSNLEIVKIEDLDLETAFNTSKNDKYHVPELHFMGKKIFNTTVIDAKNENNVIVGSPDIFTDPVMLMTKEGLFRGQSIDLRNAILVPSYIEKSNDDRPVILAIYFYLDINGSTEKVLFDTGINNLLTSTHAGRDLAPSANGKYRLLKSVNGYRLNKSSIYDAKIKLDSKVINTTYESIADFNHPSAKYLLGAEILNLYSIYFDFNKGKIYFIPVQVE